MLERCTFGVSVRVPCRNIEVIQHPPSFNELLGRFNRKLAQKLGNNMPPCLLSKLQMESIERLLGRLMASEACPLVRPVVTRVLCML